jgi:hypothetical protein
MVANELVTDQRSFKWQGEAGPSDLTYTGKEQTGKNNYAHPHT